MLLACIDIGSNTTRLLVAEPSDGGLREVLAERSFTGLGVSGQASRERGLVTLPADKIDEVASVVAAQVRAARAAGARRIIAVGTAGVRDAANADALLAAVAAASGVRVDVLSGEEEARLTFVGATHALVAAPTRRVGVVDVGGGSTELVVGTLERGVEWWTSLPVGSAVVADRLVHDPPHAYDLTRARRRVRRVFAAVAPPRPELALAVGGSAASLRALAGELLDEPALEVALARLSTAASADLAGRLHLDPRRVRLLPAGILVLEHAARAFGLPLGVGAGGLREGVILEESMRARAPR